MFAGMFGRSVWDRRCHSCVWRERAQEVSAARRLACLRRATCIIHRIWSLVLSQWMAFTRPIAGFSGNRKIAAFFALTHSMATTQNHSFTEKWVFTVPRRKRRLLQRHHPRLCPRKSRELFRNLPLFGKIVDRNIDLDQWLMINMVKCLMERFLINRVMVLLRTPIEIGNLFNCWIACNNQLLTSAN